MCLLVCCIYHKPRRFDESSSEEESSESDSDSDSCQHNHRSRQRRANPHEGDGHEHEPVTRDAPNGNVVHKPEDAGSNSNAYERAPTSRKN